MFCTLKNNDFSECVGNIAFSDAVFQTAESLTNDQRKEFSVYEVFDEHPTLEKDHRYVPDFAYRIENGCVIRTWAQEAISSDATVGIYLYKRGKDFVNATIQMIIENDRVNNEFYTCPAYNYAISNGKKIGIYEIPVEAMHGIGTPEDLKLYINKLEN